MARTSTHHRRHRRKHMKRTHKGGNHNASAWGYVSKTFGDLNTQVANSLNLQPGQDVVARHSTQSVPVGMPNANVKGVINMNGGLPNRRRGRSPSRSSSRSPSRSSSRSSSRRVRRRLFSPSPMTRKRSRSRSPSRSNKRRKI